MPRLEHDDLAELLSYALLKVPPSLRLDLAAPDAARQRLAESLIADRMLRDFRHLEVTGPPGIVPRSTGGRHPSLPLPVTEADLPY